MSPRSLTDLQKDNIHDLCRGNPLVLTYIVTLIKGRPDDDIEQLLATIEYTGNIKSLYEGYWKKIQANGEIQHLLALASRIKGVIDIRWLQTWRGGPVALQRFEREAGHFFKRERDASRWLFFHNSFKEFLRTKTMEVPIGRPSEDADRKYFRELATHAGDAGHSQFDQIYYWALARDPVAFKSLVTQEYFATQLERGRSHDAITRDIRSALDYALELQDPLLFTRLVLAGAGVELREWNMQHTEFVPTLLRLEEHETALEWILDDHALAMPPEPALRACLELLDKGFSSEAREIFDLAEPLDYLNGRVISRHENPYPIIKTWVEVATRFRKVDEISESILRLTFDQGGDDYRGNLLYWQAITYAMLSRWDEHDRVLARFPGIPDGNYWECMVYFYSLPELARAGDPVRVPREFDKLDDMMVDEGLHRRCGIEHANVCYKLGKSDAARMLLATVEVPEIREGNLDAPNKEHLMEYRPFILYYQLHYALSGRLYHDEEVLEEIATHRLGRFYRALMEISSIRAISTSNVGEDFDVSSRLELLITVFEDFEGWAFHHDTIEAYFEFLIHAISTLKGTAIRSFCDLVEREWEDDDGGSDWSPSLRRSIVMYLREAGASEEWIVAQLSLIEEMMLSSGDASGKVGQCQEQADAWMQVGDKAKARTCIARMYKETWSVAFRRDYQMEWWVDWLDRANGKEPARAVERITRLCKIIAAVKPVTEGDAPAYAADALIERTFQLEPDLGLQALHWCADNEQIYYFRALNALFKAALNRPDSNVPILVEIYGNFLLPFLNDHVVESRTTRAVVEGMVRGLSEATGAFFTRSIKRFLDCISVYASTNTWKIWRRSLGLALRGAGFALGDYGMVEADLETVDPFSTFLPDSQNEERQAFERDLGSVHTGDDLVRVAEHRASNFYAVELIAQFINRTDIILSIGNITRLIDLFVDKNYASSLVIHLCTMLRDRGARRLARDKKKTLVKVQDYFTLEDWVLTTFEDLMHEDREDTRALLFSVLREYFKRHWYPQNILDILHRLLPLMIDEVPVMEIWHEIERYITYVTSSVNVDAVACTFQEGRHLQTMMVVYDLLLDHVDHLVSSLERACLRTCKVLLLENAPDFKDKLIGRCSGDAAITENLLAVLQAIACRDPAKLTNIIPHLHDLVQSPNFVILFLASGVLWQLGQQVHVVRNTTPIPIYHKLVLEPS
ncbi:MAG: hypothetical protein GYA24_21185, partial [Candidatus Lokiarchaeota archaeon]|nr:hypothetical protein [Candidatus Lokiarchaeota archaeon]